MTFRALIASAFPGRLRGEDARLPDANFAQATMRKGAPALAFETW